jgi:myo-inositol-1(or 4)-monophosphatase
MPQHNQNLTEFSQASREAARLGGNVLLKWLGKTSTREKGPQDLVTQADFESQTVIRDFLGKEFPKHQFVGEESLPDEAAGETESEYCWIVDPLDGTTNYVHQLRSFAVSIALRQNKETIVGTVLDPVLDECYAAVKGQGATLNGTAIHNSGCTEMAKSLFVFSFGRGTRRNDPDALRFLNLLENVGSVRRLGSAALNLCYVACGRTDGYWATSLQKWDVAAGWLIATEAGATLADFTGREINLEKPHFCITATPELFRQVKPLLNV